MNFPFIYNDGQILHCVEYVMIYLPVHALSTIACRMQFCDEK